MAGSKGEKDKDGALWCLYCDECDERKGGVSKGDVRKETELERRRRQKVEEDRSNRRDQPLGEGGGAGVI